MASQQPTQSQTTRLTRAIMLTGKSRRGRALLVCGLVSHNRSERRPVQYCLSGTYVCAQHDLRHYEGTYTFDAELSLEMHAQAESHESQRGRGRNPTPPDPPKSFCVRVCWGLSPRRPTSRHSASCVFERYQSPTKRTSCHLPPPLIDFLVNKCKILCTKKRACEPMLNATKEMGLCGTSATW